MKTLVIKTQKELDALPDQFDEYTMIEIRSDKNTVIKVSKAYHSARVEAYDSRVKAYNSARVEAYGYASVEAYHSARVKAYNSASVEAYDSASVEAYNSASVEAYDSARVKAYGYASVEAYGSASVELFLYAYVIVFSSNVIIKKLLDFSTAVFKGCKENIEEKGENAISRAVPYDCEISFEEWLRRGYVVADGIHKALKSQKTIGEIEVFECEEFGKNESSYLVKKGNTFSHGETIEKAIEDLRFKISDRDTSNYEHWKKNPGQMISVDEAIQGYRVITGACEFGTKEFVNRLGELPEKISVGDVVKKTEGAFGNEQLKEFLG